MGLFIFSLAALAAVKVLFPESIREPKSDNNTNAKCDLEISWIDKWELGQKLHDK